MSQGDQVWSAVEYDRNVRFVSELGSGVLEWLEPQPHETILDLGCGDGELTEKISQAGSTVVGVDYSEDFVRAACERGLDARIGDGHSLDFSDKFDAVFSNAALHWMLDPEAVISNIARALKPGGRFVAEFGGHGNVAAITTAMRAVAQARNGSSELAAPWFFPSCEEYQGLLERGGFVVQRISLIPRPTPLPTGMKGWLGVFRQPFFDQFGADSNAALDDVIALLEPSLKDANGFWSADYVRLRVEAKLSQC